MTKAGYVTIIGKPNTGKSTMMNALIGSKLSIVSPKPQTTRKSVIGILTGDDYQIVFKDTPGVLSPRYELHKNMMQYVESAIAETDMIVVMIDLTDINFERPSFGKALSEFLQKIDKPAYLLLNKVDLIPDKKTILPIMYHFKSLDIFKEIIPISALNGDNLKELTEVLKQELPEGDFFYDPEQIGTQPQRFFAAEIIRENIFLAFEEEIPYSAEVQIAEFKEREEGKWFIAADIIVEKDTQKAIIIGKGGAKIKEIGEKSRIEIENHLDMEIYLKLFVKVRANWRKNKSMLGYYGY